MDLDYRQLDVLETERLHLRYVRKEDAPDLLKLYSNLRVIEYTEHHRPMESVDEAEWSIHFYRKGYLEQWMYRWAITFKGEDKLIGTAGLHRVNREHHHSALGYELHESYWNRGIATEVVGALIQYGFTSFDLHRIEAEIIPQNIASGRVLVKNGFQHEAIRRQRLFNKKKYHDIAIYGILRSDWLKK